MKRDDAIAGLIRAYRREEDIRQKRKMKFCNSILERDTIDVPYEEVSQATPSGQERGQNNDQPNEQ